jgi:MoaA/NifB/PqqE/SkfB family radical SAM enzyme
MTLPTNFCILPFVQITTHPSRSFSPCPYLGGTTWDNNYQSISDCWNSSEVESLRVDFLDNKKSTICTRCWDEEAHGKRSLRQRFFDPVTLTSEYETMQDSSVVDSLLAAIDSGQYQQGPKFLSIKNGNVCNAKCRVCHPGDSSRWIADAKKLQENTQKTIYRIDQKEINWTDEQVDEIFELSKNLYRLELFGGEPTYNKQVIKLLNRIVDNGHAKNISLYINTNGGVDILKKIPQIEQFGEIDIGVSIDGVGEQFEYIRHGIKFQDVMNNVHAWKTYFDQHKIKYKITSITTVNILNVYYLPEITAAVNSITGKDPFINLLVDPDFLNIRTMPTKLKQIVIAKLHGNPLFSELVALLRIPTAPKDWQKFLDYTQELDKIRHENFTKTFPEFAHLIELHGKHGSDLDKTDFGKVIVYVGDKSHPQGWYLENHARSRDVHAVKLTDQNCQYLKSGVYFTSLPDVKTKENLNKVLAQADQIIYKETNNWQDARIWHFLFKFPTPVKRTTQKLLSRYQHKIGCK